MKFKISLGWAWPRKLPPPSMVCMPLARSPKFTPPTHTHTLIENRHTPRNLAGKTNHQCVTVVCIHHTAVTTGTRCFDGQFLLSSWALSREWETSINIFLCLCVLVTRWCRLLISNVTYSCLSVYYILSYIIPTYIRVTNSYVEQVRRGHTLISPENNLEQVRVWHVAMWHDDYKGTWV